MPQESHPYDALLIVSFGGPEKRDDVIPFLENVLRGRNVPRERMLAVAEHYDHFGGRSPINDHVRELIAKLRDTIRLPIYWGNRNWHPMLEDTVRQMRQDGVKHAAAFVTSAFGSYSGCRQYQEDIARGRAAAGDAPKITKLRPFFDHPRFLEAMTDQVSGAIEQLPEGQLIFTAHSIPVFAAESSPYVAQLTAACAHVASAVGRSEWKLAYQSRSGAPGELWLEPDICDYLRETRRDSIVAPIGFLSDHMEVLYDLDTEARAVSDEIGVRLVRAGTVGTHPLILRMIEELMAEEPFVCPPDCCPAPQRRKN